MAYHGLLWWLSGKEFSCNAGEEGDTGSIPVSGRSPGGRNGNRASILAEKNPVDREAWQTMFHVITKSWAQLSN